MFRAALTDAPSRRFFLAHAQSCVGTGLASLALPLLAYDRFHSVEAVSLVLLVGLLPAIAFGTVLGTVVDRVGWRVCATVADVLRCAAFLVVVGSGALGGLLAGATLAGVGTALFTPAALTGLPRLAPGERRGAALGLFAALDDVGMTLGPALAGVLLAVTGPSTLLAINAGTFALSALLVGTLSAGADERAEVRVRPSLLHETRAGVRELLAVPGVRTLLACSTAVVLCIGVTNVGEVILARQVLGVGGSGLAVMVTAAGVGTILGSLAARFTAAGPWRWRQAYVLGLCAMAAELIACAFLPSFTLVVGAFAVGGFGNGIALVHDRLMLSEGAPEALHGRLFGLQRTCISFAFALSMACAGALMSLAGVLATFLSSGLALALVTGVAFRRLRATWPSPGHASLRPHGEIAQLVEHTTENRGVPGSSPGLATAEVPASADFLLTFADPSATAGSPVPGVRGPTVARPALDS
jgi:MFS family permease